MNLLTVYSNLKKDIESVISGVSSTSVDGTNLTFTFTNGTTKTIEFPTPADGKSLSYKWDGTKLGIKVDGEKNYTYVDLKGVSGEDGKNGKNGEDGKDGKSISSITKDDDNSVIVTFSDGTTQNIGKLSFNVEADFLTENGFGNLRYYDNHFQYYNTSTSSWVDTNITPNNIYVLNMIPQEMKKISGIYDLTLGKYKLKWEEPNDTVIDNQVACIVEKVVIRRKLGSVPIDENDGDLVIEIKRKDFGLYKDNYFVDNNCSPFIDDTYYYKAFPLSSTGFYNYSSTNEISILCKDYYLYGFKIDQSDSDPSSMITYLLDCDNANFISAKMNYDTGLFNYGDWSDAWFIKGCKPCMLKYDGTVDYYLNPDDYTKKLDGTNSDIANADYEGNAMIEFPKVYWKVVNNGDSTANIYFCNKNLDSDYHCWSHVDNNGNEIDYCYMPIYNGSVVNEKLRSISGKIAGSGNVSAITEIEYAKANNVGDNTIWYTEVFCDRMLVNLLLVLIGKSTDSQTIFGYGNINTFVSEQTPNIQSSGNFNTKGLFWGAKDATGVKVFGMEHYWGNVWKRIAGYIYDKGTVKVKMTYGQSDTSTVDGYNTTGSGYISIPNTTVSGVSGGYIDKMEFSEYGLFPLSTNGSGTTFYADGCYFDNTKTAYPMVGCGTDPEGQHGGMFDVVLLYEASKNFLNFSTSLSCKPLKEVD